MASYKAGMNPPPRPRDESRFRRFGIYTPETTKKKRSSWSLGHLGYAEQAEQAEALAYNVPMTRGAQAATPVYPRREDSLSKVPTSSHFGFHRTPKQPKPPPPRDPSPSKKHTRNVLRRKPSSISQHASDSRAYLGTGSSPPPAWSNGALAQYGNIPGSINSMMARVGHGIDTISPAQSNPRIIPELDRYRNHPVNSRTSKEKLASEIPHKISTQDLPPPTPLYSGSGQSGQSGHSRYSGYSASPSTQFSESSGPASYSRNTTPTSMSSHSPVIMIPVKNSARLAHNSPSSRTRPPVTRRRTENDPDTSIVEPQGLPSVRESLTSSSSGSTVKDNERGKEKKKKNRLSPPPPSPPPRKLSQRIQKSMPKEREPASGSILPPVLGAVDDLVALQYAVDAPTHGRSKTAPPMRPSREGTPDLSAQMAQLGESMAFIHGNLFGTGSTRDRTANSATAPLSRSEASTPLNLNPTRPYLHSRIPSRGCSPNPVFQKSRDTTAAPSGLGIVPDLRPQAEAHPGIRLRTPSPGSRRFGLFGRRTVTEPTPATVSEKKVPRRGPQAGTGHEGYGRYAIRGRSTSSTALLTGHDRSVSTARSPLDINNKAIQDPFLLQRMSPVIIAGGGEIMENRNTSPELSRVESSTSLTGLPRPSFESKASFTHPSSPQTSFGASKEDLMGTLWTPSLPRSSENKIHPHHPFPSMVGEGNARHPSNSSENDAKPSLALRESMQRLQSVDNSPLQLPRPINVMSRGPSPAISSHGASVTSLLSFHDTSIENTGLRRVAKSKVLEKPTKRPRSPRKQKWNFFQRAQAGKPEPHAEVHVPIVAEPPSKAVAHYAMMAMDEQEALEKAIGLEDIMREVAEAETTQVPLDNFHSGSYSSNLRRQDSIHQTIVSKYESPLDLRADVEKTKAQLEPQETALMRVANATRTRLQQVGRIPQVVPARPSQVSLKSFSRPFSRNSMVQNLGRPDPKFMALGAGRPSTAEPTFVTETGQEIGASVGEPSSSETSDHLQLDQMPAPEPYDFFRFSQRKNSAVTTSSSSFSGLLTTTESITAVIPDSQEPLKEDEVWDEYDDFVEGDETIKIRVSTTSSDGVPFIYENYESRSASKLKGKESELVPFMMDDNISAQADEIRKSTTSSEFNPEAFISGYRDRNNSVVSTEAEKKRRSSTSSYTKRKSGPPPLSMHRKSTSLGSYSRLSADSKLLTIKERSPRLSPLAQVNLRLGSLTVSKWLTFGHVLFSPIREIIINLPNTSSSAKQLRILVIDGLGNDDWSFYAAEAYPNVTFYNLSPSVSRSPTSPNPHRGSISHPATPENHRQIQHMSLAERFPFPGNMFNACILRFPRAAPESTYKNVIAETKRILKPGGWLECNILDLELGSMGNRTRRAVRDLKVQMQIADPAVHLQSSAEMLESMFFKRGFTELKSCRVGVPVASVVASPTSSPSNLRSSGTFPASPRDREIQQAPEEERSLADLMRDSSPSSDAGIAKMVAKVGRWWYTQCFESLILARAEAGDPGNESIWNDEALLRECAKWNTSFSLLVGYARKPVSGDWRPRGSTL